jgi:AhpD family alkylhydroperoxidase
MFDRKNLRHLKHLDQKAPDEIKTFWALDKAAFVAGALDVRKQLISLGVAPNTQCPYGIELPGKAACDAGATDPMLVALAAVAAATRAGAAVTYAAHMFKDKP